MIFSGTGWIGGGGAVADPGFSIGGANSKYGLPTFLLIIFPKNSMKLKET